MKYVLEYSVSQKCFHIDTLSYTLERNLKNAILKNNTDYQIIGIFDTYEEANSNMKTIEDVLK